MFEDMQHYSQNEHTYLDFKESYKAVLWPLSHIGGIYNSIRYFLTGIVTICNEEDGA